jgi:hypothetical protein
MECSPCSSRSESLFICGQVLSTSVLVVSTGCGVYLMAKLCPRPPIHPCANNNALTLLCEFLYILLLPGLFLCVSYDYGFTHNLSLRSGNEFKKNGKPDGPKTVLLLQWPLPVELFSPGNPTLAVVADTYPRIPTTSSFDFQQKSWDALESSSENILPHKLLVSPFYLTYFIQSLSVHLCAFTHSVLELKVGYFFISLFSTDEMFFFCMSFHTFYTPFCSFRL